MLWMRCVVDCFTDTVCVHVLCSFCVVCVWFDVCLCLVIGLCLCGEIADCVWCVTNVLCHWIGLFAMCVRVCTCDMVLIASLLTVSVWQSYNCVYDCDCCL